MEGWIAPALTEANPSPIPWTQEDLFNYLRTGTSPLHGSTGATMTQVIRNALALPVVPDSDIRAIALYFSEKDHANCQCNRHRGDHTKGPRDFLSRERPGERPRR